MIKENHHIVFGIKANIYNTYNMQRGQQPSCFDRVKVGFMIGFAVGMSSAGLFGMYSALK